MLADGREAEEAREYVKGRGISPESLERFGIGYAPTYPDFLLKRMTREFSPEILLEAGLATRGDEGSVRDRFRGRITFPIHDLQGRGIGFGARILPTDARASEQAKYLNTAETPIYKKNEVLFNLAGARTSIARSGEVFVVEGYTDVIGLVQAGIENAVATCGTALGEAHFRLLSRFAQRAILAFDSDEAGARAAERAYAFQETYPVQAVVMIMPQGLDPADFVAKHGADGVREAAAGSRPLVEYMVRRTVARHDLSTVEGQSAAVADALPILEGLSDPVRRSQYGHMLADLAGVSESSVMRVAGATPGRTPARGREDHEARDGAGQGRARDAEAARARHRDLSRVRRAARAGTFPQPGEPPDVRGDRRGRRRHRGDRRRRGCEARVRRVVARRRAAQRWRAMRSTRGACGRDCRSSC